jgi:hypothetical protein
VEPPQSPCRNPVSSVEIRSHRSGPERTSRTGTPGPGVKRLVRSPVRGRCSVLSALRVRPPRCPTGSQPVPRWLSPSARTFFEGGEQRKWSDCSTVMHLDVVIPLVGLVLTGFMLRTALLALGEPDGEEGAEPLVRPERGSPPIWRHWVGPDHHGSGQQGSRSLVPAERSTGACPGVPYRRRSTRSDPHSPSSTNSPESSAARQMS